MGYAVITSTSAYFAACAAATHPLIRTVRFLSRTVDMCLLRAEGRGQRAKGTVPFCPLPSALPPVFYILRRQVRYLPQLLGLASVQPLRDRERRVHANHAGVEIELRHAFEAAGRTFLDAHSAAFAVVDQNLVETVGADRARDARLRADQITVVACVARAAAEAAVRFFNRLLLGE